MHLCRQHNHFALLASLWLPPHAREPEDLVLAIESGSLQTQALKGCDLSAELIVLRSSPNDAPVNRRLRLTCPQKPGLIKSITDLLRDQACTLIEVDTNTSERNGEVCARQSTPWLRDRARPVSTRPRLRRALPTPTHALLQIMFELECVVECPTEADAAEVNQMIIWWTEAQSNRVEWIFDESWQRHRINPL